MYNLIKTSVPGVLLEKTQRVFILFSKDAEIIARIKSVLPFIEVQSVYNGQLIRLPAHDDTLQILRNLDLPVDGLEPLRFFYDVPLLEGVFTPMAHQITTAAFVSSRKRAFILNSMRTGKTASLVMATDYLQSVKGVPGAVLIVATVSNLTGVWAKTIQTTLPHRVVSVVHGGTGKNARIRKLRTLADYYIINYDGVKLVHDELQAMVKCGQISIVVVDELTHYGNISSQRFKALDSIINGKSPAPYVYGLTGSPGDNPLPVFGFVKLINPDKLPCNRLTTWKDLTQERWGREAWQWKNRSNCAEIINQTMQPAIRFDKNDIMDLPPIVKQLRDATLSKEQYQLYEKMKDTMIALTKSGDVVEAVHKASLSQKLFQIALGVCIGADNNLIYLDNSPRMNTLYEVIEEAEGKVVIFCAYTGAIDQLVLELSKKYSVAKVDGRVTGTKRADIFEAFQTKKDPHVLVCHPQTTAFGVELAAADTMVFNGPPLSGGFIYEQALERLSSLKQKARQVSIIQIAATEAERTFFSGLDKGVKSSELINNMFAEITRSQK